MEMNDEQVKEVMLLEENIVQELSSMPPDDNKLSFLLPCNI